MKKKTLIITIVSVLLLAIVGTPIAISSTEAIRTNAISDDYTLIKNDKNYQKPCQIEGIDLVEQEISCGYAVMEMFGDFAQHEISEEQLFENNNKNIVTASTEGFEKEMNKVFIDYETKAYTWLKASDLLIKCYESIENGIPVPFEMAYQFEGAWTLHFSLLIGIDFSNDELRILNPYGIDEIMSTKDFISRTSFQIWEHKPLYLSWAFGLSIFDKNTIFIATHK